ncbi:NUDIX hydrolase [Candidatus Bathyarchaeota archaeon]|nr:NUDIX hydrolase [Candidatus Bathyarchaeota archaeon]
MTRKSPLLAVDIIAIKDDSVILVKRANPPFQGFYALPGGFVEYGERVEDAAIKEMREETGLEVKLKALVGVYSDPNRDPRGHVVSIAYLAEVTGGILKPATDAKEAKLFPLKALPENLAFDHRQILEDALKILKKHKASLYR